MHKQDLSNDSVKEHAHKEENPRGTLPLDSELYTTNEC